MLFLDYAWLGGISGILFVISFGPSYLSAPDSPVATSSPQEVIHYFGNRQDGILTNNGLLLVFAAFFPSARYTACCARRGRNTGSRPSRSRAGFFS